MFENTTNNSLIIFGITFIVLIIANIFVMFKSNKELKDRIKSWWIILGTLFFFLFSNNTLLTIFFAFISYLSLKEYFSHLDIRISDRRIVFWAYISILFQYYFIHIEWYSMFLIFIPVYSFLFLSFRQILIGETKGFIKNTAAIHWGLMLFVFAFSHLAYLATFNEIYFTNDGNFLNIVGIELILYLILVTQGNDVMQYISGKTFGKHKILPKVSPNKTVEGFIGGMIGTIGLAILLSFLTPFTIIESIFAGLIISIGGFVGDVVISAIKRDIGIKDFGNLLPGHGGINDRIDSLIYTAPLFFHYINYLYKLA